MKEYKLKINGKPYKVEISDIKENRAQVTVNGTAYQAEIVSAETPAPAPTSATPLVEATQKSAASQSAVPEPVTSDPATQSHIIRAPLPGIILSVNVSKGQAVKRGDKVAVIEAMKMENEILSDIDGTVSEIYVAQGDSVLDEAKIITIA